MIIEQNVSADVRIWAASQVKIRMAEYQISQLSQGFSYDYPSFSASRALCGKFKTEYCQPEIVRLKSLVNKHHKIVAEQEKKLKFAPESRMFSKQEAIAMIGSTLHYTDESGEIYETLLKSSKNGERIFSSVHEEESIHHPYEGLDPLVLLSLGFGKTE